MMILDKWRENKGLVQQAGLAALSRAKEAGTPAYYIDDALGEGIVKEMPDGRRLLVSYINGKEHVRTEFGPRE